MDNVSREGAAVPSFFQQPGTEHLIQEMEPGDVGFLRLQELIGNVEYLLLHSQLHRLLSLQRGHWDFSVLLLILLLVVLLLQVTVNLLGARPVGVGQSNRHTGQGRGPGAEAVAGGPVITDEAGLFAVGWRADAVNAAVPVGHLLTIPGPRSQQEQAAGGLTLRELGHWWLRGWLWQHGWLWGTWAGARGWPIRGDNHRLSFKLLNE